MTRSPEHLPQAERPRLPPMATPGVRLFSFGRAFLAGLALLAAFSVLPGPQPSSVQADELTAEEEERLEAIDRHLERGWRAYKRGNYEEVQARVKRLLRYDPDSAVPNWMGGLAFARTGKYDEALDHAAKGLTKDPKHRGLRILQIRTLLERGKWAEAQAAARAAVQTDENELAYRVLLGMTLEEAGRRTDALAAYDDVLERYNKRVRSGPKPSDQDRVWVARMAMQVTWLSERPGDQLLDQANKLLSEYLGASDENEEDIDARLSLAEMFRGTGGPKGQALARKHYNLVLKVNADYPEARVGMARTDLVFWQQGQARKQLERALATNPGHPDAHALLASIHVGNGDYERAEKHLERALTSNPKHWEARSVKAALQYIQGDREAFDASVNELLADDPRFGQVFVVAAELVGERQRRYDRAKELAERAIEVEPTNRFAYETLGEAQMNLGQTDDALLTFQKGVRASKRLKSVRRDNFIRVLRDVLPDYKVVTSKNFRVRLPVSEASVLEPYLIPLLEESYEVLSEKYGVEIPTPIFVDSFDRNDDFSVRSVGSPGLPALGVCFGRVITLLGPTARPLGQFSWSRTAWHEFAHVVTLTQSEGQVPRWLTEGLSVFEEQERRDRWGRDMERQLYNRLRNGSLLKMAEINSAFRGPDILFAYYQGGLIAEHLQEARGFEVIPAMLKEFAKDRKTAEVFKDVLDLELATYDEQFRAFVERQVGDFKITPIWSRESLEGFQARIEKDPTDVEAHARIAMAQLQRGRAIDAGAALAEAKKLDPKHPEVLLVEGRLAAANQRNDLAREAFEAFLKTGEDDLEARLFLARVSLMGAGDSAKAVEHLEAAKRCFPRAIGRTSPYLQLARLYRGSGKAEKAIAELEAYAAIAAEDYGVRKELRSWYLQKEDWKSLARVCEESIDISPFGANKGKKPDMKLHREYARALQELGGQTELLTRELVVQVELGKLLSEEQQREEGVIDDRLALGRHYLRLDRPDDALEQAFLALRLDPQHAAARMLKQRAMEAGAAR